jgi:sugar lactone lactonase YvrE
VPSLTPTQTSSPLITNPEMVVLAANLPEPDDLLSTPDGSLYVSDVTDGTIQRYTESGGLQTYLSGLSVPEGMVILANGSMIIVEQGKNRLVRYDPNGRTLTPILILHNTTGQLGVDNIALDVHNPNAPTLIVPDSPNGTILRVSLDGQSVTQIASGFARPVDAWVEPDGSLLIVDENANSLKRIHPDDRVEMLAVLPIPDDVIEDPQGNIFVNTLGDNAIHLISAATQHDSILIQGILSPQGLAFDLGGNLIVTDPGRHRLIKLIIH